MTGLWLWVVWVLLWGTFTPLTLVGGVVVAAAVLWAFPVRRLPHLTLRPGPLLGLLGFLALDLVRSSYQVSREMLRNGPRSRGAILELPLASTSDRVVALVAAAYTLSPGTLVVQIDHARSRWYIYVLGPDGADAVERARAAALDVQRRVLAVVGEEEP
jgi:multicomponent Na+:H+ antiporter subunit E